MTPPLCSKCKKNVAVIFLTRIENGKTYHEGLCLKCAKSIITAVAIIGIIQMKKRSFSYEPSVIAPINANKQTISERV